MSHNQYHHRHGIISGMMHAVLMFFFLGGAFVLGCARDFLLHPMEWLTKYWFPILMLVAASLLAIFGKKEQPRRFE